MSTLSSKVELMQQAPALPKPFDPHFYRATYTALASFSDAEAERHFQQYGIGHGLTASPAALRQNFIPLVQAEPSALEIGPFHAPAISGPQVKYLDAYDKEELEKKAEELGRDPTGVPTIDYISPTGTFEMVDRKFAAAFGSHSIEHQPDFIQHLRNVSSVLEPEGRYYIICPDKRYCFDHFRPNTTIADIITPFLQEVTRHQAWSFAHHLLLMTHNDPQKHWAEDHGLPTFMTSQTLFLPEIKDYIQQTGYVDCHAWQFTPQVFFEITAMLAERGLTDLYPERVYHTPTGAFEFTAVLRKTRHVADMPMAFIPASPVDDRQQSANLQNTLRDQQSQLLSKSDQIDALTAKNTHLEKELHRIYESRSWRLTRPIRRINGMIRS